MNKMGDGYHCHVNNYHSKLLLLLVYFQLYVTMQTHGFHMYHNIITPRSNSIITTFHKSSPRSEELLREDEMASSNNEEIEETNNEAIYFAPTVIEEEEEGEEEDTNSNNVNNNEYSFFDEAMIYMKSGSGGQGAATYKKLLGNQKGVGDGGNGGKGGDVYLTVDPNLNNLAKFNVQSQRPNAYGGGGGATKKFKRRKGWFMSFRAENGDDGDAKNRNGKQGDDVYIRVPPGTIVQEVLLVPTSSSSYENVTDDDCETIATIDTATTPKLLIGQGGEGGEGTGVRAENSNKKRGVRIIQASPTSGQKRILKLTLQILADVALVGVPNAGKSTFLASVTKAKPKIANYPFTTVIPNLGVWIPKKDDVDGAAGLVLCDVPGLIRGASKGTGLGHAFLRHLERCHVILHIIDATSTDPIHDYKMLNNELVHYKNGMLATMPQVVIINKIDVWEEKFTTTSEEGLIPKKSLQEITSDLEKVMPHSRIMYISAKENDGVEELMWRLYAFVQKVKTESDKVVH